ncbi:MAG TPA: S-methyl-5-thioribose-1-phosphate isomerase [Myxococcales bacterium]|nr:S-methyl-5-thioribose-1-phosphate isomerase [Myxococcales bacterium]HIN85444.1 S-methyl-5-thioribose-1-phosphate isomerase [Myxococcales bacterium]
MSSDAWFTIKWENGQVVMLDQRRLPTEEIYHHYSELNEVAIAIEEMVIRGAPAIGIAAAMGVALAVSKVNDATLLDSVLSQAVTRLSATRPTAVNLFWGLERMERKFATLKSHTLEEIQTELIAEAEFILAEDVNICRKLGQNGAELIPNNARILTHCNAGALATGGYGTALSVIRAAVSSGKTISVFADETRPYLQGSRLTSWELHRDAIDVTVIADNAAGHFISRGEVDCVIVGSDRTVANGDVANKIGSYSLAVLCKANNIPFYAAVPISTIDLNIAHGDDIPIEERGADEIKFCGGIQLVPNGVPIRNPAFDVTPASLVTAIITERGIARPPFSKSLPALVNKDQ